MAQPNLARSWTRTLLGFVPLIPGLVLLGCNDPSSTAAPEQSTSSAITPTGSAALNVATNTWPVVTNTTAAPNYLIKGAPTVLNVVAIDADGDALSYAWTSTCTGAFANAQTASPVFTLDAGTTATSCKLSAAVSDGRGGSSTGSLTLAVGQTGAVVAPAITMSLQSDDFVEVNNPVVMIVGATDPQGRAMTFNWSADAGSLGAPASTASSSQVVWTSPATPASSWHVTVVVSNGSVSTSKTFTVKPLGL